MAQPEATRHGPAAFEHHADLPRVALGPAAVTVLVGSVAGERSPARADTALVGAELACPGGSVLLPLEPTFEHALVVLDGRLVVDGEAIAPGSLAYLGEGRAELALDCRGPVRALVLGGEPFDEEIVMSWNFVARDRAEVDRAAADWNAGDDRFGAVASPLDRIPAPVAGPGA